MPDFSELFENGYGVCVDYNGKTIFWADRFPVSYGEKLKICIEHTNSEYVQGVSIDIEGACGVNGTLWKRKKGVKMLFWEDSKLLDPKNIELIVLTKTGYMWVQNIWERITYDISHSPSGAPIRKQMKTTDSGHNGAAMIVEEIENGRRYRCNDGYPDDDFDDIIFTIQRISNPS